MPNTVLEDATTIVEGDREQTYGSPTVNLARIAAMWEIIFQQPVSQQQVCLAMMALKLARAIHDPYHRDNLVDICGYARLMEITNRPNPQ